MLSTASKIITRRAYATAAQPEASSSRIIPHLVTLKGKERQYEPTPSSTEPLTSAKVKQEGPKDLPPVQRIISGADKTPSPPPVNESPSEALLSLSIPKAGPSTLPLHDPTATLPYSNHPFHTYKFVTQLSDHGFDKGAAEAIMQGTKSLLMIEETRAANELVAKGEMENEAYLFRAALDELRTEVQVQARNDALALRSQTGGLQREVDSFNQKLREDMHDVRNA